ncbi:MAG: GlsB/YeaQ/YmgE family stress response membrane protein [Actinomycetota bacterium]
MSVLAWIIVGLIAGTLASIAVRGRGRGCLVNIAIGVIGAVIGGWLFSLIGRTGVTGLNLWSVFVAFIGAVLFLVVIRAISRR